MAAVLFPEDPGQVIGKSLQQPVAFGKSIFLVKEFHAVKIHIQKSSVFPFAAGSGPPYFTEFEKPGLC